MSRKDYTAVAQDVKRAYDQKPGCKGVTVVLDKLAQDLADTFAATNPRFDRAKFLAACGVES